MTVQGNKNKRYQQKHRKLGLCIKCPKPCWVGPDGKKRVTCLRCTVKRRETAQNPGPREKRLARLRLRDRRGQKQYRKAKNATKEIPGRSPVWELEV